MDRLDDLLLHLLHRFLRRLVQTLLHVLQEAGVRRLGPVLLEALHQSHQFAGGGGQPPARPLPAGRPAAGGRRRGGGRRGGEPGVGGSRRGRDDRVLPRGGRIGSGPAGGAGRQGERLLVLLAGVAEEHQIQIMFPLREVEVLRAAGSVGAHRLVLPLEDGPKVPELRLDVFH